MKILLRNIKEQAIQDYSKIMAPSKATEKKRDLSNSSNIRPKVLETKKYLRHMKLKSSKTKNYTPFQMPLVK